MRYIVSVVFSLVFLLLVASVPVTPVSADVALPIAPQNDRLEIVPAGPQGLVAPMPFPYISPTPVPLLNLSGSADIVIIIAGIAAVGTSAAIMFVMSKSF